MAALDGDGRALEIRMREDVSDRDALEEVIFRDFQHAKISTILMLNKYEFQRSI